MFFFLVQEGGLFLLTNCHILSQRWEKFSPNHGQDGVCNATFLEAVAREEAFFAGGGELLVSLFVMVFHLASDIPYQVFHFPFPDRSTNILQGRHLSCNKDSNPPHPDHRLSSSCWLR